MKTYTEVTAPKSIVYTNFTTGAHMILFINSSILSLRCQYRKSACRFSALEFFPLSCIMENTSGIKMGKDSMDKHLALKQYFGHTRFRPGQERLIDAILAGRDVMGVMPTGGGKSVCYQLPSLLLPGITLVISPLISLMKDQVSALHSSGIGAVFLNSSLTSDEYRDACWEIRQGLCKLLYVAPERLGNEGFLSLMQDQNISLIAVDEAHCISQWGQDFRPSYLKIKDFVDMLPRRPVLGAFTATATREVRDDIIRLLSLRDPVSLVTGFDRPNLSFEVRRPSDKAATVLELVRDRPGKSGIVYCATRANVERVCDFLKKSGIPATRYHAGLDEEERRANQSDFQFDRCPVMVATNAFGMGIDKSNVSYVIHYNMPKSMEAYYQEAGRAGRDGEPAECILLFSQGDVMTAKHLISTSGENGELTQAEREQVLRQDLSRLGTMAGYCKTTGCLRNYILNYFGQETAGKCENCGNCRTSFVYTDITREAQMILSCIKRVHSELGYYVGAALIADVLRGSKSERIHTLKLDRLSTYGLMKGLSREAVRGCIEYLEREGYLLTEPEHSTLRLTEQAGEVLFHGRQVAMPRPVRETARLKTRPSRKKTAAALERPAADDSLLSALKALRSELARAESVPAYIVFSNAALTDMAAKKPQTMQEFLEVAGVGQVKAARYGEKFLQEIAAYQDRANGNTDF